MFPLPGRFMGGTVSDKVPLGCRETDATGHCKSDRIDVKCVCRSCDGTNRNSASVAGRGNRLVAAGSACGEGLRGIWARVDCRPIANRKRGIGMDAAHGFFPCG